MDVATCLRISGREQLARSLLNRIKLLANPHSLPCPSPGARSLVAFDGGSFSRRSTSRFAGQSKPGGKYGLGFLEMLPEGTKSLIEA